MQMNMTQDNIFRTSDFPLVAALSVWLPIEAVDHADAHRAYFLFKKTEELNNLIESFHRRELRVEPQAYFHAMKTVKSRLYN